MPKLIPVPVTVKVSLGEVTYGRFSILPYATPRNDTLEIDRWLVLDKDEEHHELYELLLFSVMPRKILCKVCVETFETGKEQLPVTFTIDDQSWIFPMRARELEYEQVHYEIEVSGEWFRLTDTYVGDIISDEQAMFAEREVLPNIDFGYSHEIRENMA